MSSELRDSTYADNPSAAVAPDALPWSDESQGYRRGEVLRAKARPLPRRAVIPQVVLTQIQSKASKPPYDMRPMERDLRSQGLLVDRMKEGISPLEDIALSFAYAEDIYELPRNRREKCSYPVASHMRAFGARPEGLKHSHLVDLFHRGHFDDEKAPLVKLAAFLVMKGLTSSEQVAVFAPELDEVTFHKLQAVVHSEVEKTLPLYARKFPVFLSALTPAQREAVDLYYLENDTNDSQREVAERVGVTQESIKDRLEWALTKLAEVYDLPRVNTRKAKTRREHVEPIYRIDPLTGLKLEVLPARRPMGTKVYGTPQTGFSDWKEWQRITAYWPTHDGVHSSLLAHLPNAAPAEAEKKSKRDGRQHFLFETADAKTAWSQLPPERGKRSDTSDLRAASEREWQNQTAIDEREADDLSSDDGQATAEFD